MVDTLHTRLRNMTPFRPEFAEVLEEVRANPQEHGFKPSLHYHLTGNLQPFGFDAIFHGWKKHKDPKRGQCHKLEFIGTGDRSFGEVVADLERVVLNDPFDLETMRADVCADIPDVTVEDLNKRIRVVYKRKGSHMGTPGRDDEFLHIWRGAGESYYHGGRPNCFRIYNKTAQLEAKRKDEMRLFKNRANAETRFAMKAYREAGGTFGFLTTENPVLTRIERQMGNRIPLQLQTIGEMRKNLVDFDPFEPVRMMGLSGRLPSRDLYTFAQYECGLSLKRMVEEFGRDYAENYIGLHNPGNRSREVKQYLPFLQCAESDSRPVTREELLQTYKDSVSRQLAA